MLNLAVIGGDGIGPEVVAEGMKVLDAVSKKVGFEYAAESLDVSGGRYLERGGDPSAPSIDVISDEEIDALRNFDAVYLGAVGHPDIAPGILEKGLLLKLRFQLDQYINLRPVQLFEGVKTCLADKTPEQIDLVVIRENTEGLYCGQGGVMRQGTPDEMSTQLMVTTQVGVERCLRYAFQTARRRKADGKRGLLTLVHKTNVLTHCGGQWFRAFEKIGDAEFSDIERGYHHVDACCMYLATTPECYDTVVVPNMFGDIITDLGAAITGGMGMAASGNLNPGGGSVSMYEPVHGSAPDIAGQNKANPIAAILSVAMLLRETGNNTGNAQYIEAGDRIQAAILEITKSGKTDGCSTTECGDIIAQQVTDAA